MTAEIWRRVTELAADAMELPLEERRKFLEDSAVDKEVVEYALRLLEQDEKAHDSFLRPMPHLDSTLVSAFVPPGGTYAAGDLLDKRYKILRFIARGGMGDVYEGWDTVQEIRVALKTIRPEILLDPQAFNRFKNEVAQSLKIAHKNVCRVQNLFVPHPERAAESAYLVMEYLEGETLSQRLARTGRLTTQCALPILEQLVEGLAAIHQNGIIHCDLKSRNVMLVPDRGSDRAVIMDFGLACPELLNESAQQGTPAYMAPEQFEGNKLTFATDQFALGVMLFEMLTARLPFASSRSIDTAAREERRFPPPIRAFEPEVPTRWARAIRRCLAWEPESRFEDVHALLSAIRPIRLARTEKALRVGAVITATVIGCLFWRAASTEVLTNVVQLMPSVDLTDGPSISADGQIIAYESNRGSHDNRDIWIHSLSNGAQRRLTTNPADDTDASISPDGSLVAFRSERNGGGIYLVRTDGSGEHLLVRFGRDPHFSPDGKHIAYWVGDQGVTLSAKAFVIDADGHHIQPIFSTFADARSPMWREDGKFLLARVCTKTGEPLQAFDWWASSPDSSRIVNTNLMRDLSTSGWRPTGAVYHWTHSKFYLAAYRNADQRLVSLDVSDDLQAHSAPKPLTAADMEITYCAVSRIGRVAFSRIAYSAHVSSFRLNDIHESERRRETDDVAVDLNPSVSRDGRWLTFARFIDRIVVKDTKEENSAVIYKAPNLQTRVKNPIISWQGKYVAFEELTSQGRILRVLRRDGWQITTCSNCGTPTGWLGDESRILFTTPAGKVGLFDVRTRSTRIVADGGEMLLDRATVHPDGSLLLVTETSSSGGKSVALAEWQDQRGIIRDFRPITSVGELADAPQWTGKGDVIYLSNRDGKYCVWLRRLHPPASETPVEIIPFHDTSTDSPAVLYLASFSIALSDHKLFLNSGEQSATVLVGKLNSQLASWLSPFTAK